MEDGTSSPAPQTKRPWPAESEIIQHLDTEGLHKLLWDLNTEDRVPNLTWWWWWWIFFIKNPKNPDRPRQLMILWSTKNCDDIKVNDFDWKRKGDIEREEQGEKQLLKFSGMVAIWYYDGEKMLDPFFLKECDFEVERKTRSGALIPGLEKDYRFYGGDDSFVVNIKGGPLDFGFEMSHFNRFLSTPRFSKKNYVKHYGYEILKLYGTRMNGTITTPTSSEDISGSAYFQKVTVNAPTVPWYWGVLHTQRGDYLDYFKPHLGLGMFRKTERPRSGLDRLELPLSKNLQFYDATRDELFRFRKLSVKKIFDPENLPSFHVRAWGEKGEVTLVLKAYSRAYWRFEQKYWKFFKSILYYNEYPVNLVDFDFHWTFDDGEEYRVTREDLGYVVGNSEHAWGKLL